MRKIIGDLSVLPAQAFGPRTLIWWGMIGFILIEGGGFMLGGGSYLFLMSHTTPWPPFHRPPGLLFGTLFTVVLVLSEIANVLTDKAAHARNERATQIGLIALCVFGIVLVGIRLLEFGALNTRWDDNAYGSIVWALLALHTLHLVTDLAESIVLTGFTFTHEVDTERFSDAADDCLYWHFVVLAWLPIYALIYWVPRLVG